MNWLFITAVGLLCFASPSLGRAAGKANRDAAGCSIIINENLPKKNEPLLLVRDASKKLRLAMPVTSGKTGSVNVGEGEELVITCPGNKNTLVLTKEEVSSAVCRKSDFFINNKKASSENFDCNQRSAASLLITDRPCAGKEGTILELGFSVEEWHPLVEICHNIKEGSSYYAIHKVYGTALAGKVIQSYRPGFSRGDKALYKGYNPDAAFSQNNQLAAFEQLYGKRAPEYFENKKFLARGHLAPDADFLFGSWQLLTYFYANTAPQWQAINAGNWLGVENLVRKLAINLDVDLNVVTGTYGVLSLKDDKNNLKKAYLEGDSQVPVPDIMWKVLHNPKDNSCVAIVASNNPFLDSAPKTICKDLPSSYSWPNFKNDFSKGYIYFCDYQDFVKTVNYGPKLNCRSIMKNQ